MTPAAFEAFGREILDGYGFKNTQVTSVAKDGGIDGFGRLKVGLAFLNVAFQCKRWKIQRYSAQKLIDFAVQHKALMSREYFSLQALFPKVLLMPQSSQEPYQSYYLMDWQLLI